jgi:NAD(P)-dependent dehydrogenase (short-subunit alcohol dehydrogenase family)
MKKKRLHGQRVLVTGASRGIGNVVAHRLAQDGAEVVAVARDLRALERVLNDMEPGPHVALAFDVRDRSAWQDARRQIAPEGHLTGIVTAAASVTPVGPIGSWNVEEFRATLDLNVVGTMLAVENTLEFLKASKGSVVMFSGGGATGPLVRFDAYAASKAAVVRLAENLAIDLRPDGVRVNSVAPGFVATQMHQATLAAGPDQAGSAYFERTTKVIHGGGGDSPELAAGLVSFLLSRESVGVTGKLISARWDPWEESAFLRRLETDPDFATLRRIDDQFFTKMPASDG